MNTTNRRAALGAFALVLAFGGCGGDKKKDFGSKKTPATKAADSRPAAAQPKPQPPAPPKPEVRISELSGDVQVLRGADPKNQTWAPLTAADSFEVKDMPAFRVGADSKLTILLPDESSITADPQTVFFFSENERRELALAKGVLSVQMKDKSVDRAGMQVRTIAGIIRGPQAAFTVGVNPIGETALFVERGVVYLGDEKVELNNQYQQAQQAIEAAATGKEAPKPEKTPSAYTKVDPGKFALFTTAPNSLKIVPEPAPAPTTPTPASGPAAPKPADPKPVAPKPTPAPTAAGTPEIDNPPSADTVRKIATANTWEAQFPKTLADWVKLIDTNVTTVTDNMTKTETAKQDNLKLIEELKAARAAQDKAKSDQIQANITRSSRLLLAIKRQAHLLALESQIRMMVVDAVTLTAQTGSETQKALEANGAKLKELSEKVTQVREKTANLRPRTRAPANNLVNPGVKGAPSIKVPGNLPNAIQPPPERIAPGAGMTPPQPPAQPEISTP